MNCRGFRGSPYRDSNICYTITGRFRWYFILHEKSDQVGDQGKLIRSTKKLKPQKFI